MSETSSNGQQQSSLLLIGLLVAVGLIIAGLFLPPISIGERIGLFGSEEAEDSAPVTVAEPDETTTDEVVEESPVAEESTTDIITSLPGEFIVATADNPPEVAKVSSADFKDPLPAGAEAKGDTFIVSYTGDAPQGVLRVALPPDAGELETLDMMGWDGSAWQFIPSEIVGSEVVSADTVLPQAVTLAQITDPEQINIGLDVGMGQDVPGVLFPLANEISVGTLTLGGDGELLGETVLITPGEYDEYLRSTNTGFVVDSATLVSFLSNGDAIAKHNDTLFRAAFDGGYKGVNIDYQGVPEGQAEAFNSFLSSLDAMLSAENMHLAVTLAMPEASNDTWNSAGHDWQAIGAIADVVYAEMPLDPAAYVDNGDAERLINWATRQIDRNKLSLVVNASAVDQVESFFEAIPNERALQNFGELQLLRGSDMMTIGDTIEAGLSGSASALEWDGAGATYKYRYEASGQIHTVWLSNEGALAHRLRLANDYNVRGVLVKGLGGFTDGAGYTAALQSVNGEAEAPQPSAAAIVWTVTNQDGNIVASSTGSDQFAYAWENIEFAGDYNLSANFALGDNEATLGDFAFSVTDSAAQAEVASTEGETDSATDSETDEVVADDTPKGTLTIDTNYRQGPGFAFAVNSVLGQGTRLSLLGQDVNGLWLKVSPDGQDGDGWVYSQLVAFDEGVDLASLPVDGASAGAVVVVPTANPATSTPILPTNTPWPTVTPAPTGPWFTLTPSATPTEPAPPTPTPQPTAIPPTKTPTPWPTNTPAPTNTPPSGPPGGVGGGFELGGQTHTLANPVLMLDTGMNWVKFQHKWGEGDSGQSVADRVSNAKAQGFKVLLSMPGANTYPSSINFPAYVDFLGSVASLPNPPDAIEIWNEMNIDFEWPAGQISPSQYVNEMLRPGYQRIKAANSNIIVISGAPAPTGFDNGTNAWADDRYMAGVAAAGGVNYMDCVGVHYNAGATSPSQNTGHPADNGAQHYSWYFWPTLNMYYNTFGGARKLCITELGYLSGDDYGGVPAGFSWAAGTSVGEHAQWLSEAVSLSGNSSKVRFLIIFNVDFTHYDPNGDPQAGFGMIRPNGSCPSCPLIKNVMGR